jgi:hypothetical protein
MAIVLITQCLQRDFVDPIRAPRAEMDDWAGAAANECIVDSITLNDLEGTDLEAQLDLPRHPLAFEPRIRGTEAAALPWRPAASSRLAEHLEHLRGCQGR